MRVGGAEVLFQPTYCLGGVGSLAVVGAILVEELGECFDIAACWCGQSPNSDRLAGGRRTGMGVLTHGSLHENGIAKRQ